MKTTLRRILGILVMIAGILGLVLSIAGLISVWVVKPTISQGVENTIATLSTSIDTSKQAMLVTEQALGATVNSVGALQTMLEATANSVIDTQPMLTQITSFLGEKLPGTIDSANSSLLAAQKGAQVLDGAIKSLDSFRSLLSAIPLIGPMLPADTGKGYNPEKSLADSLGEVATQLDGLPAMFTDMSKNLDKADDNLVTIQTSLTSMASNVSQISSSLNQYKSMIAQSQSSMDNLKNVLTNFQANLDRILLWAAIVITLFFLWLLAAQVVILSQGWELYQGTTDRME
jgi:prefoldin subunit 5